MSAIRDDDFNRDRSEVELRWELENLRRQVGELRSQVQSASKPQEAEKKEDKNQGKNDQDDKQDDQQQPKPPLQQRGKTWIHAHPVQFAALVVAVLVLLAGGALLLHHMDSFESTDDAQVDGHLDAISSRVTGTVLQVNIEDNQNVVQGQTLITLDPTDFQVAVDQARSNYSQAQSQLEAENPNIPITETSTRSAAASSQADVQTAEASLAASQRVYDSALGDLHQAQAISARAATGEVRYRQLVAKDEVSQELYDQKVSDARAAEAAVQAKSAAAEAAKRTIAEREAGVAKARTQLSETQANNPRRILVSQATVATRNAGLEAAKAQLDRALLNLSYCNIAAPAAGIVGNKNVEVGQRIEAGQPLFMVTRTDDIWITANYKETQLLQMRAGQPVTVSVDALGLNFDGYVENMPGATGSKNSILPPENATCNYVKVVQRLPVRIRLKDGQSNAERLRPGMSVETSVRIR